MPASLENSAMAKGLEKVRFHSNLKEGSCQRMFTLPYNCTQFTCQQGNAQNPPSQASTVRELRTFRCTSWIQIRQKNQSQHCWIVEKQENSRKTSTSASLTTLKPLTVWITTNCGKFLKRWEQQPPYLTPEKPVCKSNGNIQNCIWKNGTVQNREVHQGCVLSPCLFNLYAEQFEMPGQMKHKLESRLPTSDMQVIPL